MPKKSQNIGILDPKGENPNPLTNEPYTDAYRELAKLWQTYPAYENAHQIIDDIQKHQVILVVAGTGSGKTVLTPKYALHALDYTGRIAITLPKKITAESAAEFGAKTLDVKLGEEVGFQYKGKSKKSDKTKLLYATDGTIVQRLIRDPKLEDFDVVIIDEAHERKVQIDFLLYLLRETLRQRPNFKLIIMSATINEKIFEDYYKGFKLKTINIGGKTNFPITSHFLDKTDKYDILLDTGFKRLLEILKNPNDGDIIFFVVSSNDAKKLCEKLADVVKAEKTGQCSITCDGDIFCVEVYSGMRKDRETLAKDKDQYKKDTSYVRKVVIATPVAESSLTIDGIKYVIDSGYELFGSYDPDHRARRLEQELISHAQAKQRMGRAGRTGPGVCYHLYTKQAFDKEMKRFPLPDIRTSDISSEYIKLLSIPTIENTTQLRKVLTQFIEPPEPAYVNTADHLLVQHGLISNGKLTSLGQAVLEIPLTDIMAATAVLFGKIYRCSYEVLKIAVMCETSKNNIGQFFISPANIVRAKTGESQKAIEHLNKKYDAARKKFAHATGDHLSLLRLLEAFEKANEKHHGTPKLGDWAYDHFLKLDTLMKARKDYRDVKYRVHEKKVTADDLGLAYNQEIANLPLEDRVLCCLIIGYRTQTAAKKTDGVLYRTLYSEDLPVKLSRNSFLTIKSQLPKHVLYGELFISMGKTELNITSGIPEKIIGILSK